MFQTLVLYEDFAAGSRARNTCNLIMAKLGDEFELRCSLWKFEVLRNTKLNQLAAAEATEADAIIVAAHGSSPLPVEVTTWIDAWLPARGDHPAALIALVDSSYHRADRPSAAFDYLRSVATAANMDFLPQVAAFHTSEFATSNSAVRSDANIMRSGDFSRWDVSGRHWGINE